MTVKQLIEALRLIEDQDAPITVLSGDRLMGVEELPFRDDGPVVTMEGGGAGVRFAALNVA